MALKSPTTSNTRIILRIEIKQRAVQRLEKTTDNFGLKKVEVTSRLMMWIAEQPEMLQAMILGLHLESYEKEISFEVIRKYAALAEHS